MKKTIEDLEKTIDDNVSEKQELRIKKAWSLIKLFSDYSSAADLINKAITEGLNEVNFTLDYEAVKFGACHKTLPNQQSIIQIDANAHPIEIIDGFFFELQNSINTKLNSITPAQYLNANEYADAMELAETISVIEHKKLILEFVQNNNKTLENLFTELNYPESWVSMHNEIKSKVKYFSAEYLKDLFEHREIYVNQWLQWKTTTDNFNKEMEERNKNIKELGVIIEKLQKKLSESNDFLKPPVNISALIKEENVEKLEEALSSPAISINSYHIKKAIDTKSSKILELLLKDYKDEIYEVQIFDLIQENNLELIKMLLPYISEISNYSLNAAIKNENIDILKLLLSEHKGNLYEYQLFSVTNQEIIEIVKNHPNYELAIPINYDSENIDQQFLAGTVEDNSDFLS